MATNIVFDPSDIKGMFRLMEEYGDSELPFGGKNENGEDIMISICKNSITVRTFQKNGWMRINTYTVDGNDFISEEMYEK